MGNKTFKGIMASVLAIAMIAPTAACNQGGANNGSATKIEIANYGGGIGKAWLEDAIVRFKEQVKNTSYETGKSGVEFKIIHNINVTFDNIKASGTHIYLTLGNKNTCIQNGSFLNINDVVKEVVDTRNGVDVTIEDKIPEEYRYDLKGADGNYYCLPYYEYYEGMTYDAELFTKEGLYLADPADGGVPYACTLTGQTVYFVADTEARKACGNDGVYGTEDDGLPTSLYELVALCDYMKSEKSVIPFTVAGNHLVRYSNKLLCGLWASLSGTDMNSAFQYNGNVDYVEDFDDSKLLFPGDNTIKAPKLEKDATVSLETGYKGVNQAGRYYAMAFMELAHKQGWFDTRSTQSSHTHKEAMRALLLSGVGTNPKVGMLIEGTYWYPEAEGYGLFTEYQNYSGNKGAEKDVRYFNLPTSLNETVTEGNGRKESLAAAGDTYAVINGNLAGKADKEGIVKACKDFIKFLYTDAELQNFTKNTGAKKGYMDYDVTPILSELSPFKKSLMAVGNANADAIIRQRGDNTLFQDNSGLLTWGDLMGWRPALDGMDPYTCVLLALRGGLTAEDCFNSTGWTEDGWSGKFNKYFQN